jgi:DNA-directed RNA polymerase subunit beta
MHTLKNLSLSTKKNIKQQWLKSANKISQSLNTNTIRTQNHNSTKNQNLHITRFDRFGIIRPGSWVQQGDTLVGKRKKQFDTKNTPEEQLLYDIFGNTSSNKKPSSSGQNEQLQSEQKENKHFSNNRTQNETKDEKAVEGLSSVNFSLQDISAGYRDTSVGCRMPQEGELSQLKWSKQYRSDIFIFAEEGDRHNLSQVDTGPPAHTDSQVGNGISTPFTSKNNKTQWNSTSLPYKSNLINPPDRLRQDQEMGEWTGGKSPQQSLFGFGKYHGDVKFPPEIKDPHNFLGFGCGFGKDQGDIKSPPEIKDSHDLLGKSQGEILDPHDLSRTRTRADHGDLLSQGEILALALTPPTKEKPLGFLNLSRDRTNTNSKREKEITKTKDKGKTKESTIINLPQKDSYEALYSNSAYSTSETPQYTPQIYPDSANEYGQFKDTSFVLSHDLDARVLQTYFFPENAVAIMDHKKNSKKSTTPNSNTGTVIIYLIAKRSIQIGDKLAGRHGNKGIVSNIIPQEDMPYLSDGTPIDLLLNPLGVPSRMNVGQVYECLLGLAGTYLNEYYRLKPFDESYGEQNSRAFVYSKLYQASTSMQVGTENLTGGKSKHSNKKAQWLFHGSHPGKTKVFDGRSGELFEHPITVGVSYIMKLVHLVDEKMHARSTGPYSLITQQPLKGRSKHGGQRLGEMEVWAFEGFGASYLLQEMMTIKSDDIYGRNLAFREILNKHPVKQGALPESFRVVAYELRALCFDIFYTPD